MDAYPIIIDPSAVYLRVGSTTRRPRLQEVIDEVCRDHDVTAADVRGRGRTKRVAAARHEIWARLLALGWSSVEVGRVWGCDHSSVLAGAKNVARRR